MLQWHTPSGSDTCFVCLAGSVMAQTLNTPIDEDATPSMFPEEHRKLSALNEFREGMIAFGLNDMKIELPEGMPATVPILSGDTTEMIVEKVIAELEKFNL